MVVGILMFVSQNITVPYLWRPTIKNREYSSVHRLAKGCGVCAVEN
jgi:hypothetical protein